MAKNFNLVAQSRLRRAGLSVMSEDYTPISWEEAARRIVDPVLVGEVTVETIGSLAEGRDRAIARGDYTPGPDDDGGEA